MRSAKINCERLLDDLSKLASFGALPAGGIDRPAFSAAHAQASEWLVARMTHAGLRARVDDAGNVIGRLGPDEWPALVCGSHIDTVPGGGAFDGSLGVIAALECARVLVETGADIGKALEVVAFCDEEGAYLSMLGSRAMTGGLSAEEAGTAKGRDGEPLAGAMQRVGLSMANLARAERPPRAFDSYLELHIEQGPVLEAKGLDVGIVGSIIGVDIAEYVLKGQSRHAGTTPMDERRDAGRAACEAITAVFAAQEQRGAPESRLTFGALEFVPGASNVVPGGARAVSEVRAARAQDMRQLRAAVDSAFDLAAARHALTLEKRHLGADKPSHMAPDMIDLIAGVCSELDFKFTVMPSGASHDASNFAELVPTGMIFVASRGGVSHHPEEFSEPRAVVNGAAVLLETIKRVIAARWKDGP